MRFFLEKLGIIEIIAGLKGFFWTNQLIYLIILLYLWSKEAQSNK